MKKATVATPQAESGLTPPEPTIIVGDPIESALESRVQETSLRLAVDRARIVIEREHRRPSRQRVETLLLPFTDTDEAHLLGLGLAAASIERAACAAIVKQVLDAETYQRVEKYLRRRGTLGDAQWKAFKMTAQREEMLSETLTTLAVAGGPGDKAQCP